MDHEIGGASSSVCICSNVGSSALVFSSPGPLLWSSASSLDSVDQTCLYCALYKNRPRGQGLGASVLGQVVAFGSRKKVGFRYQRSLPSEPFCPEPLRSPQADGHSSWVHSSAKLPPFTVGICHLAIVPSICFLGGCSYEKATPILQRSILPQHCVCFGKPLGPLSSEPTPRILSGFRAAQLDSDRETNSKFPTTDMY